MALGRDRAEAVAAEALGWIAGDGALLDVFMGSTGIGAADLRSGAGEPELLAAVLDFLMQDDAWVTGFCDATGHDYGTPAAARAALPGGVQTHWT
ncbi:DUF3572 domain-containing protein [Rhodosalinus halophilus]|jgi:hypothetical protein|uniref:DUF3572 domain-containing protein n=1 Tax=Rhodosalinus halophilus TaxID=2259333 RepID=A0A365UB70_9RHOB|nr:DUF3572 domain-containing protein [Rhodosalinus halophilus]RBI86557.1 DUF3572 domain-containing protein [Rhodosalinus halophilus]